MFFLRNDQHLILTRGDMSLLRSSMLLASRISINISTLRVLELAQLILDAAARSIPPRGGTTSAATAAPAA